MPQVIENPCELLPEPSLSRPEALLSFQDQWGMPKLFEYKVREW